MLPFSEQPRDHTIVTSNSLIELLLFVDRRSTTKELIQDISHYLDAHQEYCAVDLKVVEVSEQPYLVEYYRLVATPALVKTAPLPWQVLAGNNLFDQLQEYWPQWEYLLAPPITAAPSTSDNSTSASPSVEIMQLSDEIFKLQQEKETLLNQLKFKDRIIAMLAHDLRNPLTAAAIALETLEGQWDSEKILPLLPTSTLLRLTQHARSQTQVIERMITNLLEAARGSRTSVRLNPQKLDLGALCKTIITETQDNLQAKLQTLDVDIPSDLPLVLADTDHVRQVVINLLDNAIKYTPTEGMIQLSVLHRTTQKVQVSICDNGLGIPQEKQEHIFEDKFRLSRDQNQEGYGLGLAFCQRIVRAHYGQVWVDSTPNKGSCFHFTLPVYRESA